MLADVVLIQVDEKNEKLMQFVENAQHPQKYPNIRLKIQSVILDQPQKNCAYWNKVVHLITNIPLDGGCGGHVLRQ